MAGAADLTQQRVVLHVPRADLQDVDVPGAELHIVRIEDLGDDRQAGLFLGSREQLEPVPSQTLEVVRRRARFERASAQHVGSHGLDRPCGRHQLLFALDGARPGHHDQRSAGIADREAVHPDDARLGLELA